MNLVVEAQLINLRKVGRKMKILKNYAAGIMAAAMLFGAAPISTVAAFADTSVSTSVSRNISVTNITDSSAEIKWTVNPDDKPMNGATGTGVIYMVVTYKVTGENEREYVSDQQAGLGGITLKNLEADTNYTSNIIRVSINHGMSSSSTIGTISYKTLA